MVNVTIEIDAEVYRQAEKVCSRFGLTLEEAFLLFAHETARLGRLPFEITGEERAFLRFQEKEKSNKAYLEKLSKGLEQVRAGHGIKKTMAELEAMENDENEGAAD